MIISIQIFSLVLGCILYALGFLCLLHPNAIKLKDYREVQKLKTLMCLYFISATLLFILGALLEIVNRIPPY